MITHYSHKVYVCVELLLFEHKLCCDIQYFNMFKRLQATVLSVFPYLSKNHEIYMYFLVEFFFPKIDQHFIF